MKKTKYLLSIGIIPLLLSSCNNKPFVVTEFLNYRGYDVTEAEHDAKLLESNNSLGIASIDYESTSYSDVTRGEVEHRVTEEYGNSKYVTNTKTQSEHSLKFNHSKSVFSSYSYNNMNGDSNSTKANVKTENEYVSQVHKKTIVQALRQRKVYKNIADFSTYPTFAAYIRDTNAISPTFALDKKETFMDFILEDVPTKYYANDNIFTSGIEYKDRQLNTADYERTLSVSAVNQIVIKKNTVTINYQYEIKDIYYNFTDAYRTAHMISYSKYIVEDKVLEVETLTFGNKVSVSSVNIDDYSLVDTF